MIPMDIDIRPSHSLPAASLRSFRPAVMVSAAKRARSPETTFDYDRPAKRLVLGMREDGMDSGDFSDSSFGMLASASSSRFPSEDWVRQAKGLSIDNQTPSRSANSSYENLALGSQSGDVDMMMDSEDGLQPEDTQQTAVYTPDTQRYRPYANLPNRSHPYLHRPEINVTPATPTSTAPSVSSSTHDLSELRASLIPTEASPMSISPTPSFSQTLSPQSPVRPSRPKFSMGPRADCEKCRLGVKGHWAHFN